MTFTSVGYALFLAAAAVLYYVLPRRAQNGVLLLASLVFYCFALPAEGALWRRLLPLLVLAACCVFTYFLAQAIAAAPAGGARRRGLLAAGVCVCIGVLAFFKYFNYAVPSLLGAALSDAAKLSLPVGISFYTFAVVSYLVDVYRGDMPASRDFVAFAAFVTFFATITSGPICRAQKLLPQLAAPRAFDAQRTCDALRLALLGFFRQIAVANIIGLYVNQIFASPAALASYSGLTLIFAACMYALELYFEFAGYSDVARASALLLGLDVPVNFKTPYFSTNFSGFWSRWHISLSAWLNDYIFMPLVWGRWTSHIPVLGRRVQKPPMISSLIVLFFLSGLWHGNTWPFVVWGLLQAAYRVGEELLHRFYKKPVKKPKLPLRIFKTAGVFVLWTASLVFFRIGLVKDGSVHDCFAFLGRQFTGLSLSAFAAETSAAVQAGFYTKPFMVALYFAYLLFVLCIAFYTDWLQCFRYHDAPVCEALARRKPAVRWLCYYLFIGCVLAAFIMQSGGFGTVSFAYANF